MSDGGAGQFSREIKLAGRARTRWLAALLTVIAIIAFSRTIGDGFLIWDDATLIVRNPDFVVPDWGKLLHYWTDWQNRSSLYMPVTYMFWGVVAALGQTTNQSGDFAGLNPAVFHTASLLLHVGSALLLFILLLRVTRSHYPAFFDPSCLRYTRFRWKRWPGRLKHRLSQHVFCNLGVARFQHLCRSTIWGGDDRPRPRADRNDAARRSMAALFARHARTDPGACSAAVGGRSARDGRLIEIFSGAVDLRFDFSAGGMGGAVRADGADCPDRTAHAIHRAAARAPDGGAGCAGILPLETRGADRTSADLWAHPTGCSHILSSSTRHGCAGIAAGHLPGTWRRARWLAGSALLFFIGVLPVLGLHPFVFQRISTTADRYLAWQCSARRSWSRGLCHRDHECRRSWGWAPWQSCYSADVPSAFYWHDTFRSLPRRAISPESSTAQELIGDVYNLQSHRPMPRRCHQARRGLELAAIHFRLAAKLPYDGGVGSYNAGECLMRLSRFTEAADATRPPSMIHIVCRAGPPSIVRLAVAIWN